MSYLHNSIAEQLISDQKSFGWTKFPSVSTLSSRYGVSRVTVSKAIKVLIEQDLVISRKRGGIWKKSHEAPSSIRVKEDSVEKTINIIKGRIAKGEYKTGSPLPKTLAFTHECNISSHTLGKALKKLIAEKIIYKKGKAFIVGAKRDSTVTFSRRNGVALYLLMYEFSSWQKFLQSERLGTALGRFTQEAQKYQINFHTLLYSDQPKTHIVHVLPSGFRQVTCRIKSNQETKAGMLILYEEVMEREMHSWLPMLGGFKKPVVFLCAFIPPMLRKLVSRYKNIFLCAPHADSIFYYLEKVLQEKNLKSCGYFKISTECNPLYEYFEKNFFDESPVSFVGVKEKEAFWENRKDNQTPLDIISRLSKRGTPAVRRALSSVMHNQPELLSHPDIQKIHPDLYSVPLFAGPDMAVMYNTPQIVHLLKAYSPQCILAHSAVEAISVYLWMIASTIKIPENISIISLMNHPILSSYPISAIDQGLDNLGYILFHFFLKDIPIHISLKKAHISSEPFFVDRGSVGRSNGNFPSRAVEGEVR